ncbi:FecR domain-containing protein [Sphingosinicella sp. BN140058]|uniref:FecR family protein n=1 Tax=Sphingosinicella sp. BN140058 TaxID=1892855 RepID=UPI0010112B87|nr:FecR domain-containing protein [Sphingosinicella sp. BN140058]QAY78190.1 DUF4880 domain-containing protein [Sphingosinicella sp. BN140058]
MMPNEPRTDSVPPSDETRRQAATWFARMRGPDAEESRDAFETWLAASASNRTAYNRAAEIFALGKLLPKSEAVEAPAPHGSARPARRHLVVTVAGLLAIAAFASLALRVPMPYPTGSPDAERPGSRSGSDRVSAHEGIPRSVRLADGSTVDLDGGTMLVVDIDGDGRRLRLAHGAARFHVFHDPRPFVVSAGGGSVIARGTVFDVALTAAQTVRVRLIEGSVEVRAAGAREDGATVQTVRMAPGQAVTFPASSRNSSAGIATLAASRDFASIRLAELVGEANRTARRPIEVVGAVGDLRVSGRFRTDDTDLLASRLAALFGLDADRSDPGRIVLRPH